MRIRQVLGAVLCCGALAAAQDAGGGIPRAWLTAYELSGCTRTPRYAETMAYFRRLERHARWIKVTSFGTSPQGRELPCVIISRERAFTPAQARATGKPVVMIQNGIHAGEIDGKDACLMLARDIAITRTREHLLDHAILVIIPIFNVDGHERFGRFNRINQNGPEEMGWRVTAQNLNLNRDYMKADAPEMQAWLRLYTSWLPDFFVDCHVTDGADFQHVATYGIETHENASPPVRAWIRDVYLPMLGRLATGAVPVVPYIFLRDDADPLKGLSGGTSPPRFSTGYTALENRPGLLIETHMLKSYRQRVEATYLILDSTIALVNREAGSLRRAVREADRLASQNQPPQVALGFDVAGTPSDSVRFYGYRQTNTTSELSGGTRIIYSHDPYDAVVPLYDSVRVTSSVTAPFAYLIPREWTAVIDRLRLHGVALHRLTAPAVLDLEAYRFSHARWDNRPFEGRHMAHYDVAREAVRDTVPAGTVVVFCAQRSRNVAVGLLEPEAPDALAAWGFFDAVFEQKEYAEAYVMEDVARSLAAADPGILAGFRERLASDTAFARSASERLNFFYQRSPYWDARVNLYPVTRLEHEAALPVERLP